MRTVKASEVVKGMRVQVVREFRDAKVTIEGVSRSDYGTGPLFPLTIGDQPVNVAPDHPVTVLAEPESEWVEGAWYWTQHLGNGSGLTLRKRSKFGWVMAGQVEATYRVPDDAITVLGRVLIVDWPGDDAARDIFESYSDRDDFTIPANQLAAKVADAIRTQGGTPS